MTDASADAEVAASVDEVWARIETLLPRSELAAALDVVVEHVPPLEAEAAEEWRAQLVGRYNTVRPFLEMLTETIAFGATPEGAPVLAAMRKLPELIGRKKVRSGEIDGQVVPPAWRRLVYAARGLEPGTIDRRAYVFCVLEQFHRHLRRRDVYAHDSDRWGDPRTRLLDGQAWEREKHTALTALKLPEDPDRFWPARPAGSATPTGRWPRGCRTTPRCAWTTTGSCTSPRTPPRPTRPAWSSCASGCVRCCRKWSCPSCC